MSVKPGQVAHLDHDSSDSAPDNLAFLCLEHHDQYDSRPSQSKGFTEAEVKAYRRELCEGILPLLERRELALPGIPKCADPFEAAKREEQRRVIVELLAERRAATNLHELSARVGAASSSVERRLFELSQEGVVRIDRRKGSARKAYSLTTSIENELVDTFVASLDEPVVADTRFLHVSHDSSVDAYIETASGSIYVVELLFARKCLGIKAVQQTTRSLSAARQLLKSESAIGVLLIGISRDTVLERANLKALEDEGLLVQFVEIP